MKKALLALLLVLMSICFAAVVIQQGETTINNGTGVISYFSPVAGTYEVKLGFNVPGVKWTSEVRSASSMEVELTLPNGKKPTFPVKAIWQIWQ